VLQNVTETLDLDGFFGMTEATENGHETWNMDWMESIQVRFTESGST
jgi:hypothetical protein